MRPRTDTWSDLPPELLVTIAEHHSTPLGVLRLRSICRSWRNAISHDRPDDSWLWSVRIPFPISHVNGIYSLTKFSICYLECPGDESCSSSTEPRKGWLVKIEELGPGRLRALEPVSTIKLVGFPKLLNFVDMRVFEIARSFSLSFLNAYMDYNHLFRTSKKVVVSSVDGTLKNGDLVMVNFNWGNWLHIRVGDDKWRHLDKLPHTMYSDVIFRKERFYALDRGGRLLIIDRSLNVELCPWTGIPLNNRDKKYLVEASGHLYLVVNINSFARDVYSQDTAVGRVSDEEEVSPVCFEVYCFKEEEKTWIRVYSLGELAFFVAEDCSFSVVARDCPPYSKNCIYYADYDAADSIMQSCCVFDLAKDCFHKQLDIISLEA
ncbi:hypothetical protein QQ045_019342 [Rhodiola kirilowii]